MIVNDFILRSFLRWAVVLAFDVRVEKEAQEHADSVGS